MNIKQPADDMLDIEELDHVGDVVLIVEGESPNTAKFLVSSKVLGLASPVFAALFLQNFSEGGRMIEGNRPEITLRDDDPAAMRKILGILHYKDPGDEMEAKMLAALAIHCDKYTCIEALRPWIKIWFTRIGSMKSADDYGLLLLAAHFFRMPESFAWVSSKAQKDLTPDVLLTWEIHEHLDLLPCGVINDLIDGIEQLLVYLHSEVQSVEGLLRNCRARYVIQGLDCFLCGRSHPAQAKKCHPCKNTELHSKHCTVDSRVADYFVTLRHAELWPTVDLFQKYSVSDLAFRISCAKNGLRHSCGAWRCPLEQELEELDQRVQKMVNGIKGFSLYPLHANLVDSGDDKQLS